MKTVDEGGFYERVVLRLKEREKELQCLYRVEECLKGNKKDLDLLIRDVIRVMPPGWQHPTICEVRVIFEGKVFTTPDFKESPWMQHAEIVLDQNVVGRLDVAYTQNVEAPGASVFLPEEQKLLNTIAETLGHHIFIRRLRATIDTLEKAPKMRPPEVQEKILSPDSDLHWKWRLRQAKNIAEHMDLDRFGVKAVYLIGSTKNATAGPGSDIDLLVHFEGNKRQEEILRAWLEGWSLCLAEISFLNTGYHPEEKMLDLHLITDEDIRKKTSYAVMIGSLENSARLLRKREE